MTAPDVLSEGFIAELPQLRRYARVLTGNLVQADRLVLATLAYARCERHRWQQPTSLRTWLFTIMHGLHRKGLPDLWRKLKSLAVDFNTGSGSTADAPVSGFECVAGPHPILLRLARLPCEQREVLLLVVIERLAYAAAASVLGVPIATVLARLNRARDTMRLCEFPLPN